MRTRISDQEEVRVVDKEQLARELLQTIFDEFGPEGVSVDDIEEITHEMRSKAKCVKMMLDSEF